LKTEDFIPRVGLSKLSKNIIVTQFFMAIGSSLIVCKNDPLIKISIFLELFCYSNTDFKEYLYLRMLNA
jgi:hypothetical protein